MSYSRPETNTETTIQKYPKMCMRCKTEATDLVFAHFITPQGKSITANGGMGLYLKNREYVLKSGFEFRGWVTRCGGCYLEEVEKRGRSSQTACGTDQGQTKERVGNDTKGMARASQDLGRLQQDLRKTSKV